MNKVTIYDVTALSSWQQSSAKINYLVRKYYFKPVSTFHAKFHNLKV